ncbi:MAG: hypothetical protein PHN18_10270 [Sulfurospirillaceae bacterium]|nr:hypothetical protein [Sulfurospirillaceae bacterium]MDD2827476.1 hypothetical protein [Sulfurospirillaceae bacterium]
MQRTSTVLMPFAKDIQTGQRVGIDEVPNGLACNCVCISCGMQVKARQGNKQRIAHFAHHKKAETECKISYWVSIRSIAEQILEQATFIHIPKINNTTLIKIQSVEEGYSAEYQFTFDLKLNTSIGTVFVYFLTGEGYVEGRNDMYREELLSYRGNSLILEINIESIKKNHDQAKAYLSDLLINQIDNKNILTSQQISNQHSSITLRQSNFNQKKQQPYIKLDDYKDFIVTILGYKDLSMFDSEDLQVCSQMLSFYHDRSDNLKWHNLQKYHVGIQAQVVCVARIRTDYFIYTVDEIGKINIIKKAGSQFIVEQFIKGQNIPAIKQQTPSLDESKMLRAWISMSKKHHQYIEKYTIVFQAWNIKIACYKSTYFGFLKHNDKWLIFDVTNNKINIIDSIEKEEGIQSYIEARVEQENNLF